MQANSEFVAFPELGLSSIALSIGPFDLRWYSLAYLAGIFIGYWYLLRLIREPGSPMGRRHADDLVFYAALGMARALACAGDGDEAKVWKDRAAALLGDIADPVDREISEGDLAAGPWFGVD